jgi:hypothetical protein
VEGELEGDVSKENRSSSCCGSRWVPAERGYGIQCVWCHVMDGLGHHRKRGIYLPHTHAMPSGKHNFPERVIDTDGDQGPKTDVEFLQDTIWLALEHRAWTGT